MGCEHKKKGRQSPEPRENRSLTVGTGGGAKPGGRRPSRSCSRALVQWSVSEEEGRTCEAEPRSEMRRSSWVSSTGTSTTQELCLL